MGREYVDALFDGFARHLNCEYRRCCITDQPEWLPPYIHPIDPEPDLAGWWNKLALFKPGNFRKGDRVLYSDLDTKIIADVSDFAAYRGRFAAARDFFNQLHISSTIMAWEAGALDHIWTEWARAGRPRLDPRGDQRWIGNMEPKADRWQDMLPGQLVSYKGDVKPLGAIPPNARIVAFHGKPRPHEVKLHRSEGDQCH